MVNAFGEVPASLQRLRPQACRTGNKAGDGVAGPRYTRLALRLLPRGTDRSIMPITLLDIALIAVMLISGLLVIFCRLWP